MSNQSVKGIGQILTGGVFLNSVLHATSNTSPSLALLFFSMVSSFMCYTATSPTTEPNQVSSLLRYGAGKEVDVQAPSNTPSSNNDGNTLSMVGLPSV